MSYAIIGSGAIGSALATQFARAAQEVVIANSRGPASLKDLTTALGSRVKAVTLQDALTADVIILAVPFNSVPHAVRGDVNWLGKIVVDATNAIDFPAFTPTDLKGKPSTEVVASAVPGAQVVKAFNTLPAAVLKSEPRKEGGRRVLFVSGDHSQANQAVAKLIDSLGFSPIVLGPIATAGLLQQFGGPLMVHNLSHHV